MNSRPGALGPVIDGKAHHGGERVDRSGNCLSCGGKEKERERKEEESVSRFPLQGSFQRTTDFTP